MVRDLLFFLAGCLSTLIMLAIGINSLVKDSNKKFFQQAPRFFKAIKKFNKCP